MNETTESAAGCAEAAGTGTGGLGVTFLQSREMAATISDQIARECLAIEVVAGYLRAASEDARTLAEMLFRPVVDLRVARLAAERLKLSRERCDRAIAEWAARCAA